jgi:hypothetical protein
MGFFRIIQGTYRSELFLELLLDPRRALTHSIFRVGCRILTFSP